MVRGTNLYRLDLDINGSEFEPSVDVVASGVLTELGLPGPVQVALLDVTAQLAHKIHAATQPTTDTYQNDRYRDVLDALIIAESVALDYEWTRIVCPPRFARRSTHGWPPDFTLMNDGVVDWAKKSPHTAFLTPRELVSRRLNNLIATIEGALMYGSGKPK